MTLKRWISSFPARVSAAFMIFVLAFGAFGWAVRMMWTAANGDASAISPSSSQPGRKPAAGTNSQEPHPLRFVETWVWLNRTNARGLMLQTRDVVHLKPGDPILKRIRSGDASVNTTWLPQQVAVGIHLLMPAGGDESVGYGPPALQLNGPTSGGIVTVQGYRHVEAGTSDFDPQTFGLRLTPPTDPTVRQTITLTAAAWSIVGITGSAPERQDARSLTYLSAPVRETFIAWVDDKVVQPDASEIKLALGHAPPGNSHSSLASNVWSWILWLIVLVPAWAILLVGLGSLSPELRRPLRAVAGTGLIVTPILAIVLNGDLGSFVGGTILLLFLPTVAFVLARLARGRPFLRRRELLIAAAVVFVALLTALPLLSLNWNKTPPVAPIVLLIVLGAVGVSQGTAVLGFRSLRTPAAAVAIIVATVCIGMVAMLSGARVLSTIPLYIVLGLLWVATLAAPLMAFSSISTTKRWLYIICIGVFGTMPFSALASLGTPPSLNENVQWYGPFSSYSLGTTASAALLLTLIVAFLLILWHLGGSAETALLPSARAAVVGLVVVEIVIIPATTGSASWWDGWRILTAIAVLGWLLPKRGLPRARRLAAVTSSVHYRLVRHELLQRIFRAGADDSWRSARAKLAAGELELASFEHRQKLLMPGGGRRRHNPDWIGIGEAAFGSSTGSLPWTNAVFAAWAGLALSIPYVIYEEFAFLDLIDPQRFTDTQTPLIAGIGQVAWLLRWSVYGLAFGYFYPLVRGQNPIAKAIVLWVAILPIEVIPLLDSTWDYSGDLATASIIRAAQLLAFAIGLGLVWEMRIMRAAELPWSLIRNFSNLKSLGTPVTAIILAAATAAATVLASSTVSTILKPPAVSPPEVSPAPSHSSEPAKR